MLALNVGESMSYTGCAGTPSLTPRMAAAAMSMVTARTESKHQFVAFSHKIVPLMISSDMTLNEVLQLMKLVCSMKLLISIFFYYSRNITLSMFPIL